MWERLPSEDLECIFEVAKHQKQECTKRGNHEVVDEVSDRTGMDSTNHHMLLSLVFEGMNRVAPISLTGVYVPKKCRATIFQPKNPHFRAGF